MPQQRNDKELDDLDRTLIAELRADPRHPYATLGSSMGVTGMTAATRLRRLRRADLIRFRVHPNLEALGVPTEILGLMQVETDAIPSCSDVLAASPHVFRVDQITGEYDLSFLAAFSSERAIGGFVRDMRTIPGVRRFVLHHQLQRIKDEEGWAAVFQDERSREVEQLYELAVGVEVPEALRPHLSTAAEWSRAVGEADAETLEQLSAPDIVFTVMPPRAGAGTYTGLDQVLEAASRNNFWHLWQRVLQVSEGPPPFTMVVDLVATVERTRGQVRTALTRLSFEFAGDRIQRVVNMGQFDLPDVAEVDALVLANEQLASEDQR